MELTNQKFAAFKSSSRARPAVLSLILPFWRGSLKGAISPGILRGTNHETKRAPVWDFIEVQGTCGLGHQQV